ncbi:hypothetical protein COLO4_05874 [Corchorus olitorius]|uniref:Uncharacterized protein n=1 Tax=Corchorus olitorius TaxID=93759 RepID=A0A1R3KPL8_9ROSI|nr:hypothetical protein COLO4_05874 [Corchorus olitorius]
MAPLLLAIDAGITHDEMRGVELEALEERRDKANKHFLVYQQRISKAYDKMLRRRSFEPGDQVLRAAEHVMRGAPPPHKFSEKWEGPYIVHEVHDSGYCTLLNPETITLSLLLSTSTTSRNTMYEIPSINLYYISYPFILS